jgi:excisionase family DNA binding protein
MLHKKDVALSCDTGTELPLLFKVPQAAQLLGLSISSVNRLIARGELKVIVKLRHRLIPRSEIEKFLNAAVSSIETRDKEGASKKTRGVAFVSLDDGFAMIGGVGNDNH